MKNAPSAKPETVALINSAKQSQWHWNQLGGKRRADILVKALENTADCRVSNEIIEKCHTLLSNASIQFSNTIELPGPTGEANTLSLHGRGVFLVNLTNEKYDAAIQQVIAALAAGNAVIIGASGEQLDTGTNLSVWLKKTAAKGANQYR